MAQRPGLMIPSVSMAEWRESQMLQTNSSGATRTPREEDVQIKSPFETVQDGTSYFSPRPPIKSAAPNDQWRGRWNTTPGSPLGQWPYSPVTPRSCLSCRRKSSCSGSRRLSSSVGTPSPQASPLVTAKSTGQPSPFQQDKLPFSESPPPLTPDYDGGMFRKRSVSPESFRRSSVPAGVFGPLSPIERELDTLQEVDTPTADTKAPWKDCCPTW